MNLLTVLGLLAVLLAPVSAAPPKDNAPKIKESVVPPRVWALHSSPPPDHTISLRIGLPQEKFHILEEHLLEISDPDHDRYGAHLSKEEVHELLAPPQESVELVSEWLASHGIVEGDLVRSPAKDWVTIRVPVSLAEKMLDTKYYVWQHENGDYTVRTTSYSLPAHLHAHVDVIQPTTMFAQWKGMKSTLFYEDGKEEKSSIVSNTAFPIINAATGVSVDPACNVSITISCLKQLYNAVGYVPKATKKNSIAATGYLEQNANIADLQQFYADQVPEAVGTNFTFISVKGGVNDQNISLAGGEANLDTQFAFGLSFPTPGTYYVTAGRPPFKPDNRTTTDTNEPYVDWIEYVLSHPSPPKVISTSYGEEEQTVPLSYARRTCAGLAAIGARGVSLTFSSGDGGVGDGNSDPATQKCITNDGRAITRFQPTFPSTCPYVTSIGGTVNVPEIAVFFSGGGFSDYWSRPSYQAKAVGKFLDKLPKGTYAGLYNTKGRAYPDVAAQGRRFRVFLSGRIISIGGTSASSPTFAAIVALLNDARLAKGLPTLGFLNPLLYKLDMEDPKAFNDIVEGNNPGCGTPGFNATSGWDPVTGLGTPNFGELVKLVT